MTGLAEKPNVLAAAIHQALAPRPYRRFHQGDLKQLAQESVAIVSRLGPMTEHVAAPATARTLTAFPLLIASITHSEAICTLLSFENPNYGASVYALFRAQIEQFLRGAFFAEHATDEEVAYFRKNDELKKRNGEKLTVRKLAELVQPELSQEASGTEFVDSVVEMWGPLCGFVHGGSDLLNMYTSKNEIGPASEPRRAMVMLRKAVALAFMATYIASRQGDPKAENFTSAFTDAYRKFEGVSTRINAFGPWKNS